MVMVVAGSLRMWFCLSVSSDPAFGVKLPHSPQLTTLISCPECASPYVSSSQVDMLCFLVMLGARKYHKDTFRLIQFF